MPKDIVLIGPMKTGKSTLGKLLSEALKLPQCSMDVLRWDYYKEIGYSNKTQKEIAEREGVEGVQRYWKPFEAHAVVRLLAEHHDCVIDFGAGHSVYDDESLFASVQKALAPYDNVILLLPCSDLDESARILNSRLREDDPGCPQAVCDLNTRFVGHHCNQSLAKIVMYTFGKTPRQTCEEIAAGIQMRQ